LSSFCVVFSVLFVFVLCCILCLVCLRSVLYSLSCLSSSCVLCVKCCQCIWIVHSWLPRRVSPTFIAGRVCSSYCNSGIRRATLVKTPMVSHDRGNDGIVIATTGQHLWHRYSVTIYQVLITNINTTFEAMTSI
jgi:hypothetical protein